MSGYAVSQTVAGRPQTLTWAVLLTAVTTLVGNVAVLFGGSERVSGVSIVIGLVSVTLHLIAAWGLWNLRRWGWIMTLILTMLDIVMTAPFFFDSPADWFVAASVVFLVLEIAILALVVLPTTRGAVQRG